MHKQDFELIYALLLRYSIGEKAKKYALEIALCSFGDRHLFEDLGFEDRGMLQEIMSDYYPALAVQKPKNIRWKKFLFNSINSKPPACEKCKDRDTCHEK